VRELGKEGLNPRPTVGDDRPSAFMGARRPEAGDGNDDVPESRGTTSALISLWVGYYCCPRQACWRLKKGEK
jgi:hypothetical protein